MPYIFLNKGKRFRRKFTFSFFHRFKDWFTHRSWPCKSSSGSHRLGQFFAYPNGSSLILRGRNVEEMAPKRIPFKKL